MCTTNRSTKIEKLSDSKKSPNISERSKFGFLMAHTINAKQLKKSQYRTH